MSDDLYQIEMRTIDGEETRVEAHRGKVLLVVNTASQCGFTPQYKGLEQLYERYRGRGFEVLAFPCNQFGHQEPGSEAEIAAFCETRFGVTFPLHQKIDVNGPDTHPLFVHLKARAPGLLGSRNLKWNFTKFLVGRDGQVRGRFAPSTAPEKLASKIEAALDDASR